MTTVVVDHAKLVAGQWKNWTPEALCRVACASRASCRATAGSHGDPSSAMEAKHVVENNVRRKFSYKIDQKKWVS